jgi:hypothetical protein
VNDKKSAEAIVVTVGDEGPNNKNPTERGGGKNATITENIIRWLPAGGYAGSREECRSV